jgi:uracil-DNA glycosylase family 4
MIPTSKSNPTCLSCPLGTRPGAFVPLMGTGAIPLLILGDFPLAVDGREGQPLAGKSQAGVILNKALNQLGVSRDQIFIWNVINCVPPGEQFGAGPQDLIALSQCSVHLDSVITQLRPKAILAVGDLAIRVTTGMHGKKQAASNLRGYIFDSKWGIPVVAAQHPEFILTSGKPALREPFTFDLGKALQLAKDGGCFTRPDTSLYEMFPPVTEGQRMIEYLRAHPDAPVYYDIETAESTTTTEDELRATRDGVAVRSSPDSADDAPWDDVLLDESPSQTELVSSTVITQIQFATDVDGWAQVFNWEPEVATLTRQILDLPNVRIGWNSRLFDDPIIRGAIGPLHTNYVDLMNMWHRYKPDLPMGLQFATSYFWPTAHAWKHLHQSDPGLYGCNDVISLQKGYPLLRQWMEMLRSPKTQVTVLRSFDIQDRQFMPALDSMQDRGYPCDQKRLSQFSTHLGAELDALYARMLPLFPPSLCSTDGAYSKRPTRLKKGYTEEDLIRQVVEVDEAITVAVPKENKSLAGKTPPPEVVELIGAAVDPEDERFTELPYSKWLKLRTTKTGRKVQQECWTYRKPFNPNSRPDVLRYLDYQITQERQEFGSKDLKWDGTSDPRGWKTNHVWEVPENPNEAGKPWAGAKGLERLQNKLAAAGKPDPLLPLLIDRSKIAKMKAAFADSWKPTAKSLVHTSFKVSPATGQIASVNPNILADPKHGTIAKQWRAVKKAHSGRRWVCLDFAGFHALTTGFEANDPSYIRAARIDIHGILGYVKERLPEWERLVDGLRDPKLMADEEIAERVKVWARKNAPVEGGRTFKERRDKVYKPTILGNQFGMRPRKMFKLNPESFIHQHIAQEVWEMEKSIWPTLFAYQDKQRARAAAPPHCLVTRYGFVRFFYDVIRKKWEPKWGRWTDVPGEDSEKAVAFEPANDAFGHVRDTIIYLHTQRCPRTELTWAEKFGLVNNVHDSLENHCPVEYADECIDLESRLAQRRNLMLVDTAAPDGLWCGAEMEVGAPGEGLDTLQEISIPQGPFDFDIRPVIGWV